MKRTNAYTGGTDPYRLEITSSNVAFDSLGADVEQIGNVPFGKQFFTHATGLGRRARSAENRPRIRAKKAPKGLATDMAPANFKIPTFRKMSPDVATLDFVNLMPAGGRRLISKELSLPKRCALGETRTLDDLEIISLISN